MNESDTATLVENTIKEFGKLDILVNNAGVLEMGTIENTSLEQYDRIMNVNVRAIYNPWKHKQNIVRLFFFTKNLSIGLKFDLSALGLDTGWGDLNETFPWCVITLNSGSDDGRWPG